MRKTLEHDTASGELKLVMTDRYNGQHERTVYTCVNLDGSPVRTRADLDGAIVYGSSLAGGMYVKAPVGTGELPVRTMPGERSATERTPCPKAANWRRKCALCAEGN